jgi:hypothetical protein
MNEESDRLHRLIYESLRIAEDHELSGCLADALEAAQQLKEELEALLDGAGEGAHMVRISAP